jgi:hypothetical protein
MKSSKRALTETMPVLTSSGTNKTFQIFRWLRRSQRTESRGLPKDRSSAGRGFGNGQRSRKHISNPRGIEGPRRFNGGDAVFELIDQAARAVQDAEARANVERYTRSIAEMAVRTLQRAVKRIEELEAELESSRTKPPSKVRTGTPDEIARHGMTTLVARALEKIIAIAAYSRPRIRADATLPGISDQGISNVGWTEILARADAALNEASVRAPHRPLHHKNHLASQQAA